MWLGDLVRLKTGEGSTGSIISLVAKDVIVLDQEIFPGRGTHYNVGELEPATDQKPEPEPDECAASVAPDL